MLFGMIVFLAVGITCVVLGIILWKKQEISLVHDYHTRNVKRKDIPAYTRLMGIGLIAIGAGCVLTGVIALGLGQPSGWFAFPTGLVAGIILFTKAQKIYNGGWLT